MYEYLVVLLTTLPRPFCTHCTGTVMVIPLHIIAIHVTSRFFLWKTDQICIYYKLITSHFVCSHFVFNESFKWAHKYAFSDEMTYRVIMGRRR